MRKLSIKKQTGEILKRIESEGFHPIDVEYHNNYFIFDHGKNHIVHFHIKECKGWKFGIWWNQEQDGVFDFFAQYEKNIDKFKPSASTFVEEDKTLDGLDFCIDIIKFIHKRKYVAFHFDMHWSSDWTNYITPFGAWKEYISYRILEKKAVRINKKMVKRYLKITEELCKGYLQNYKIVDFNSSGAICYPRFEVVCDGAIIDDLEEGQSYSVDINPSKILRKMTAFDKKIKKLQRKGFYLDIDEFRGKLDFFVKGEKNGKTNK